MVNIIYVYHLGTKHIFPNEQDSIPFQDICQGNVSGSTIWVAVIAPILGSLRTVGNGVHFTSPLSQQTNHIVACAFMDDTDLISGDFRTTSLYYRIINARYTRDITQMRRGGEKY